MKSELWYDVLVVGGGGAALRAALSAWQQGARTAILSKVEAGKSGATYYSVAEVGAFNVPDGAADPSDSPEAFFPGYGVSGSWHCTASPVPHHCGAGGKVPCMISSG